MGGIAHMAGALPARTWPAPCRHAHGRRPAGTHMAGALPARALHPTAGILGARADSIVASPKYVKWWVSEI